MPGLSQFKTDRTSRGRWTITFNNPPINMFGPATMEELTSVVADLEADPFVKVVVFQSANPEFFIAHLDLSRAAGLRLSNFSPWFEFVLRLATSLVVSIAESPLTGRAMMNWAGGAAIGKTLVGLGSVVGWRRSAPTCHRSPAVSRDETESKCESQCSGPAASAATSGAGWPKRARR